MEGRLFSDIDDIELLMPSEDDLNQFACHLLEEQLMSASLDEMPAAGNVDAVNNHVLPSSFLLLAPPPNHQSSSMEPNWSTEYSEANLRLKLDLHRAAVVSKFPNGIPSDESYGGSSTDKRETQTAKNIDSTEEKQLKRKRANREAARRFRKKKRDNVYDLLEQLTRLQVECQKLKKENEVWRAQDKELRIELAKVQVKNRELEFKVIELFKISSREYDF